MGRGERERLRRRAALFPLPGGCEGVRPAAARKTKKPIYVTESGIGTDDDTRRIAWIDACVAEVDRCLAEGIDVRSYIYWSLLDNFEWTKGYRQHFGLVAVDRATFARRPKPSARHFAQLIAARAGSRA